MEVLPTNLNMNFNNTNSGVDNIIHKLHNKWVLWAHLPHDTNWNIDSYIKIFTYDNVENTIAIASTLPEMLVKNCMLFVMKEGINPMWEDPQNKKGGCFSYKVLNKNVCNVWRDLTYTIVGETISSNVGFNNSISGITISPKKNFCIIKIWINNCTYQNPSIILDSVSGLSSQGCLFKQHAPSF